MFDNKWHTPTLRITNGNCKIPCSGILGSIRLGRLKTPTPHSTTFCRLRGKPAVFPLSQPPKRQLPVTLDEIGAKVHE